MAFKKGKSGNPKGKPKGATNKLNKAIKEVIHETFNNLQCDAKTNMLEWAKQNPTEFYKLASKLIPTETKSDFITPPTIQVFRVGYSKTNELE